MNSKFIIFIVFISLFSFVNMQSVDARSCTPDAGFTTCVESSTSGLKLQTSGVWGWTYDGKRYYDSSKPLVMSCEGGDDLYIYETGVDFEESQNAETWFPNQNTRTYDLDDLLPMAISVWCSNDEGSAVGSSWGTVHYSVDKQCLSNSDCGTTQYCNDNNPYETFCEELNCGSNQFLINQGCVDANIPDYCGVAGITDYYECQVYLSQNIDLLEGTLDSKIDAISDLQADIEAKADIITRLTQNLETQSDIINQLTTDFEERQEYIVTLTSNLEEQGVLIKNLENSIEEKAEIISNLNLNVQEQADMINQLTSNLQEKADLIKGLTSENEVQAELILLMEESFQAQSDIVQNLDLTIQEDAVIIKNLDLTVEEQAKMINDFELTLEQDTEIITELNLKLDEQEELIEKLGIENQNTIMNYIIMSGISALVIIITVFIILRKKK